MFKQLLNFAAVLTVLASVSFAHAEIIFEVESSVPDPIASGTTGILTFSVAADTAAEQAMEFDAFQVGFVVSSFGGADLSDINFTLPTVGENGFGASSFDLGSGNFGVIGARGAGLLDLSLDREIFAVGFNVTGGSIGGFNIDVATATDGSNSVDPNITGSAVPLDISFAASPEARLNFAAVPEPSSAVVLVAIAGLVAVRRRRS